jgi:uncharacterized RDD family membrane protein YckC
LNPDDPYGALEKNNQASGINSKPPPSPYGGFWVRLGALFIDVLIWAPVAAPTFWMSSHCHLFQIYWWPFGTLLGIFYSIYLVKRFGGTPGKLILGLRIAKVNGSPVGYKEATLRYLPDFILGLFLYLALVIALSHMSDAEYMGLTFLKRAQHIKALEPDWTSPVHIMQQVWMWSEFVVLLTNKKKRALHDFIAGTVVLRKNVPVPPS